MEEALKTIEGRKRSGLGLLWARLRQNKLAIVGLAILLLFIINAIAAPLLAPHDPFEADLPNMLAEPSADYPLGADEMGRCILSRIIYGARISLIIGVIVIGIGIGGGVPLGVASAYYVGKFDFFVQHRLVGFDLQQVVPAALDDRLGDGFLATDGVDADDRAGEVQQPYKLGNCGDFVAFFIRDQLP